MSDDIYEVSAAQWQMGLDSAMGRLGQHIVHQKNKAFPRFDARDREALAYLLGYVRGKTEVRDVPPCMLSKPEVER